MEYNTLSFSIWGLIGAIFWLLYEVNAFKRPELYVPQNNATEKKSFLKFLNIVLGLIAWGFITFSLAGPRKPIGLVDNQKEVNDIFFAFDVSRSMLANDFKPNRLEVTKKKVINFIKMRPRDRIGIVIFAEKVFTLVPLTTDIDLVSKLVSEIEAGGKRGFLGSGTNIGDALGLAVGRLTPTEVKNKVIILLTDGVSNVGKIPPLQAAEKAGDQNIKVYTLGVGSDEDAQIPVPGSPFGGYQYIPGGSIDFETLENIAKMTGGKMFPVKDEKSLEQVFNEIDQLERTEINDSGRMLYEEKDLDYLFVGVFLLLFSFLFKLKILKEVL